MNFFRHACLIGLVGVVLSACGGGGGGDDRFDRDGLQLLAEYVFSEPGGASGIHRALELNLGLEGQADPAQGRIFGGFVVQHGAHGVEAEAHAGNEPNFAAFAERLTNGAPDSYRLFQRYPPPSTVEHTDGLDESDIVASIQGPGVDLANFVVDLITLEVLELTFESPGPDPNGDGNFSAFRLRTVLRIWGR